MHFTPKSRQLLSFVASIPERPISTTKPSAAIMKSIYTDLQEAYQYVLSQPSITFQKKQVSKRDILFPQSMPAPKEIVRHIYDHIRTEVVSCTFHCAGRNITLYWMFEKEVSIQLCREYTLYVKMWFYLLNKYASKSCAETLVVYFYLTSHEKKLPDTKEATLDVIHVNTAFTTTCPVRGERGEIVVFRREEWFKVFLHETFHTFALDFSDMNNEEMHRCIHTLFRVPSKINAFEAYSEFWAETVNVAFASFFSEPETADIETFKARFETGMNVERRFSYFQLSKVLHHMGLTYDDLLNTKNDPTLGTTKYKENTNVLAYYVIKTVLMNQYPAFLQWCKRNNAPSLMAFRKTRENQTQLCLFIEKHYKHPVLLQMLRVLPPKGKKGFITQTLRMSVLEWM